ITAETGTSDQESGANINISASNLLTLRLQNESLISATANADADGGNITIDAPFLLAYPASGPDGNDIIAKAVRGAGGQITVNALGIFGISEGRAIAGNGTNNFDASSEFGAPGVVQLNQAVDPNRGLTQLPETVTDPNELIAQNVCRRGKESELTQTGKGGLPPSLEDDFQGEQNLPPLVEPVAPQSSAPASSTPTPISSQDVQPAQGWILNAQGQIELVSYQTQGLEVRRRSGKVSQCP
ncbi:MAG: filamentous hemagglutinin, partial [Cyanobacteriota bacterium]|nr:filamentous hemagglutinin [Cyanobacteriota bacterium]